MKNILTFPFLLLLLAGCAVSRNYNPTRKFSKEQLLADYSVFRGALEEAHPSLYWYTPKDSMDYYFNRGARMIGDSMTETQFRTVLSFVIAQIKCGHTSVRPSKKMSNYLDGKVSPLPVNIKAWADTAVITSNVNRKDSMVKRGMLIRTIDGRPIRNIFDTLFYYLNTDGYSLVHKYQSLSNRNVFPSLYTYVFGVKPSYKVTIIDTTGTEHTVDMKTYYSQTDTTRKRTILPVPKIGKREQRKRNLAFMRNLRTDSALRTSVMELNTFSNGYGVRSFFKKTFHQLRKDSIANLVIDLRSNGGGSVSNSNLLTKFVSDHPFKVGDSLYAVKKGTRYGSYRHGNFMNWLFMVAFTRKKSDGHYHFGYFEKKFFKPKTKDHFNGHIYVLTGGNTFSASTLFAGVIKGQSNVTVVGEETGGGAYGNTAWLIPDVTLPNTGVRFRLPLFRLVINKDAPHNGRGILPDVEVMPTVESVRQNRDLKMEKVRMLIEQGNELKGK